MTRISQDIGYERPLLEKVFKCKCGSPLLMFGCDNLSCKNSQINKLKTRKE